MEGGGGKEGLGQGYQLRQVLREETYTAAIKRTPIALETIYALHSSKIFFSEKPTWDPQGYLAPLLILFTTVFNRGS